MVLLRTCLGLVLAIGSVDAFMSGAPALRGSRAGVSAMSMQVPQNMQPSERFGEQGCGFPVLMRRAHWSARGGEADPVALSQSKGGFGKQQAPKKKISEIAKDRKPVSVVHRRSRERETGSRDGATEERKEKVSEMERWRETERRRDGGRKVPASDDGVTPLIVTCFSTDGRFVGKSPRRLTATTRSRSRERPSSTCSSERRGLQMR
jgi:hypothetical protein